MRPIFIFIALLLTTTTFSQVKLQFGERNKANYFSDPQQLIQVKEGRYLLFRKVEYSTPVLSKVDGKPLELYDENLKLLRKGNFPDKYEGEPIYFLNIWKMQNRVWAYFQKRGKNKTTEHWVWELDDETIETKGAPIKIETDDEKITAADVVHLAGIKLFFTKDGTKAYECSGKGGKETLTVFDADFKIVKKVDFATKSKSPFTRDIVTKMKDNGDFYFIENCMMSINRDFETNLVFIPASDNQPQVFPITSTKNKPIKGAQIAFLPEDKIAIVGVLGNEKGADYPSSVFKVDFVPGKIGEMKINPIPLNIMAETHPDDRIQPKADKKYKNRDLSVDDVFVQKNGNITLICQNNNFNLWFFNFKSDGTLNWGDWVEISQLTMEYQRAFGKEYLVDGDNLHLLYNQGARSHLISLNDISILPDGKIENKVIYDIKVPVVGIADHQMAICISRGVHINSKTLIVPFEEKKDAGLLKIYCE
jgi:hypothetical protein